LQLPAPTLRKGVQPGIALTRSYRLLIAALGLALGARHAGAQFGYWPADTLLASGRVVSAESAYYAAARLRPRDPIVRAALGRYLASRGAEKVGAVLIEEARRFGGDSVALAIVLVPIYRRAADYKALAALEPEVLSVAEQQRVAWLGEHAPQASFRDSTATIRYQPLADGRGFGTVVLRFGRAELPAIIDPRVTGLVLPSTLRSAVRVFGIEGTRTLAVATSVRIGGVAFSNIPAVLGAADEAVRVGLDVLAPYAPSFDPRAGALTFRRMERRSRLPVGIRLPAMYDSGGVRVLIGGRWQPTTLAGPALLFASRRWLWDGRRGDVVLLP
jgi:hypothetical protein